MIFNGDDKLIILEVSDGTSVRVEDIYASWKEWVLEGNTQYLQAMSSIGGDPITDIINLGATFFLENGWKIRPYEGDQNLEIIGNIYTRDSSNPIVPTLGSYRVLVTTRVSNLIDTVSTGGSSISVSDIWAYNKALTVSKFLALK